MNKTESLWFCLILRCRENNWKFYDLILKGSKVRNKKSTKIRIPAQNGIMQIKQEDIIYFYTESNYYYVVTTKGKVFLVLI